MPYQYWAVTKTWHVLARDEEEAREIADEGDLVDVQAEPVSSVAVQKAADAQEEEEDPYNGV